jgi:hypothetical protein
MGMLKEADFVRNGNTKKINNLRRPEQDGIWDALIGGESQRSYQISWQTDPDRVLPSSSMTTQATMRNSHLSPPESSQQLQPTLLHRNRALHLLHILRLLGLPLILAVKKTSAPLLYRAELARCMRLRLAVCSEAVTSTHPIRICQSKRAVKTQQPPPLRAVHQRVQSARPKAAVVQSRATGCQV